MNLPNIFRRAPPILPSVAEVWEHTRAHPAQFVRAQAAPCVECSAKFRPFHATTFWHQGDCGTAFRARSIYPESEVAADAAHLRALRQATAPARDLPALRPAVWPAEASARADAWTIQRESGGSANLPTDNRK